MTSRHKGSKYLLHTCYEIQNDMNTLPVSPPFITPFITPPLSPLYGAILEHHSDFIKNNLHDQPATILFKILPSGKFERKYMEDIQI